MPLIKGDSDKDRNFNVLSEIHAGKPREQAIAIGYSIQRKAAAAKRRR